MKVAKVSVAQRALWDTRMCHRGLVRRRGNNVRGHCAKARCSFLLLPQMTCSAVSRTLFPSVKKFGRRVVDSGCHVDILIIQCQGHDIPRNASRSEWELKFATNHLAITRLLMPSCRPLVGGARVVAVSSAAHHTSRIHWQDIYFECGQQDYPEADATQQITDLLDRSIPRGRQLTHPVASHRRPIDTAV
jgi:hypothetical protein